MVKHNLFSYNKIYQYKKRDNEGTNAQNAVENH